MREKRSEGSLHFGVLPILDLNVSSGREKLELDEKKKFFRRKREFMISRKYELTRKNKNSYFCCCFVSHTNGSLI